MAQLAYSRRTPARAQAPTTARSASRLRRLRPRCRIERDVVRDPYPGEGAAEQKAVRQITRYYLYLRVRHEGAEGSPAARAWRTIPLLRSRLPPRSGG